MVFLLVRVPCGVCAPRAREAFRQQGGRDLIRGRFSYYNRGLIPRVAANLMLRATLRARRRDQRMRSTSFQLDELLVSKSVLRAVGHFEPVFLAHPHTRTGLWR